MSRKEIEEQRKSTIIKIIFLSFLLFFAASMYLESRLLVDAIYLVIVFIIFVRFIIMKLYQ